MKKPFYLFLFIFLGLGCQNNGAEMNPFLIDYDTPYQIPPFEKIEFSHYEPAFEEGMKIGKTCQKTLKDAELKIEKLLDDHNTMIEVSQDELR